jgi:hypothetical protein
MWWGLLPPAYFFHPVQVLEVFTGGVARNVMRASSTYFFHLVQMLEVFTGGAARNVSSTCLFFPSCTNVGSLHRSPPPAYFFHHVQVHWRSKNLIRKKSRSSNAMLWYRTRYKTQGKHWLYCMAKKKERLHTNSGHFVGGWPNR